MGKDNLTLDTLRSDEEDMVPAKEQHVKAAKRAFLLREQYLHILAILIVLVITAVIFTFRDRVVNLEGYGYLGAFLVSLISNATILLPIPGIAVIFALGDPFNPFLIGLAAGAGATLGELTGYVAGYGGRSVIENRKLYSLLKGWMRRKGSITIFVFSLVPFFPFDLAGLAAGAVRFSLWRFVTMCWFGRTLMYIGIALAGAWGLPRVIELLQRFWE